MIRATLRVLRQNKGMTQGQAAKALGINQSTYSALENIDKKLMMKIAKLYDVNPSEIELVD